MLEFIYMKRIDLRLDDDSTPTVINYNVEEMRNRLVNPNKVVINDEKIQILFSYPLTNKVMFTYEKRGGFTRMDLFRLIYEGYKKIYNEEEAEVGDPGIYEILYNRKESDSKYGIWGHYIDDLWIEILYYDPSTRILKMAIGS